MDSPGSGPGVFLGRGMSCTCVVGLQWGDEAKGKIVDLLADGPRFRRPLQRRRQRRPHRRLGRTHLQALAVADRRPEAESDVRHRQRRRRLSAAIPRRSRSTCAAGIAVGENLAVSDHAHVIFPYHMEEETATEETGERPSARPAAASARATRTRSAAVAAFASANCCIPITFANGCEPSCRERTE